MDDGVEPEPPRRPAPAPVPRGVRGSPSTRSPPRGENFSSRTPIWLLDVDGVLNAVTNTPDRRIWADYRTGHATAQGRQWPITWSPTVARVVREVWQRGRAEVLWLTTWEDDANGDLADLLELPRLPVAGHAVETRIETPHRWWKLQVAQRIHDADRTRPLLWTDDDLAFDEEAVDWIATTGLGISPYTSRGLEPAHLQAIASFTGSLNGTEIDM